MNDTLFPVKEVPVTYDTPKGDVESGYKLIVREDNKEPNPKKEYINKITGKESSEE